MKKLYLFFLMLFCCSYAIAGSIDEVIFFGDSLTDNGNIYKAILKIAPKSPPYFRGRFANGPVWSEVLGKYFYDKSYLNYIIYAFGGATAVAHLPTLKFIPPATLEMEINNYIVASHFKDKSKALYSLWIGGNDYIFYSSQDTNKLTSNVVDKITWSLTTLIKHGAKHFLVLNLPDLSKVPLVRTMGTESKLYELSIMHNQKLQAAIRNIQMDYPDIKIVYVNTFEIFDDFLAHPDKYNKKYNAHITDTHESCWKGGYVFASLKENVRADLENTFMANEALHSSKTDDIRHFIINSPELMQTYSIGKLFDRGIVPCTNPDEHFFWDSIHPTQVVHRILAAIVADELRNSSIPI